MGAPSSAPDGDARRAAPCGAAALLLLLVASVVSLATGLSMCGHREVFEASTVCGGVLAAGQTARDSLYLVPSGVVLGLAVVRPPAGAVLAALPVLLLFCARRPLCAVLGEG
jgi:ABC-type proline/glycine betaine transport system permease subunit